VPLRDVFMTYLENHIDPDTIAPLFAGSKFKVDRKQALMDPIMERDLNPYRTATYTLAPKIYKWPNYLPLPPAPTPVRQTDPRAGDYRDSLTGADAWAARYVAAFGPTDDAISRIKMLRITVVLDDANNRLAEGQTYEYVIGLP